MVLSQPIPSLLYKRYVLICFGLLFFTSMVYSQKRSCQPLSNPYAPEQIQFLENFTKNFLIDNKTVLPRNRLTIPVVVHVLWRTPEENISDEQILSQIEVLNLDFNKGNENQTIVSREFQGLIANVGIEFCLASIDPDGKPTTGITRTQTIIENIGNQVDGSIYYTARGGKDAWDTDRYLNIWVADTPQLSIGFGSKPGEKPPAEDGVIVNPLYFGTTGIAQAPFDRGRTTTHEIGHYLNLFHLTGNDQECNTDDHVEDTPNQETEYFDCPATGSASCGSKDLTVNYMNFVDDACMAMFTHGQALRMRAALFGARQGLLSTQNCSAPPLFVEGTFRIFPNPARDYFCMVVDFGSTSQWDYQIIATHGGVVFEGQITDGQINTQYLSLAGGTYWVRVRVNDIWEIARLVVIP